MSFKIATALLAATLGGGFATAAHAADTTQVESGNRALTLSFYSPLGQTFTAAGADLLSFGFQLQSLNPAQANGPITFTLYNGSGFGGSVLATQTVTPTTLPLQNREPGWLDFDFSGLSLSAGQTYTAALASASTRFALMYGPTINIYTGNALSGDAYAGGHFLASGYTPDRVCASGICDANFRMTFASTTSAVPEPATWGLMILGFGVAGAALRRGKARRPANA
jgi:hypothetical protein